jgi:hypothetical protein
VLNRNTLNSYKRFREKSEGNKIPLFVLKNKKDSVSTLTPVTVDTVPAQHEPIDDVPNDNKNRKKCR